MRPVLLLLALVSRVAGLDDCDPDAAASFDGTTTSFEALPSVQIGSYTGISVAMWVKWESGVPLLDCSAGAAQDNLVLEISNGITWSVRVGQSGLEGMTAYQAWPEPAFPENEWKHVMVVQSATTASIYLDGVLLDDESVSFGVGPTVVRDCILAKTRDGVYDKFVGEMCAALCRRTPRAPRCADPVPA